MTPEQFARTPEQLLLASNRHHHAVIAGIAHLRAAVLRMAQEVEDAKSLITGKEASRACATLDRVANDMRKLARQKDMIEAPNGPAT